MSVHVCLENCDCRASRNRGARARGLKSGKALYCARAHRPVKVRRLSTGILRCPRCGRTAR